MGCSGSKPPTSKTNPVVGASETKGTGDVQVAAALKSKRRGIFADSSLDESRYVKKQFPKNKNSQRVIATALKSHFLFANLRPDEVKEVIDAMQPQAVNAGHVVIKQGDEGDNFYVVEAGSFDIYVNSKKVAQVSDGHTFGELALLYNSPRAATVAAATGAKLWALDRVTFRHIIAHSSAQQQRDCRAALRRVLLFDDLSDEEIQKVAAAVQLVNFRAGQTIIKKGTRGQVFYLIKKGTVMCTNVGAGKMEQADITFSQGDYFGERSLMKDQPRAANVIAKTDVELMALDKLDFDNLLGQGHMKSRLEYNMGVRVLQCVPIFRQLSADEREQLFNAMQRKSLKAGQTLVKQGAPNNMFFIIQEGTVRVVRDGNLSRELGAGEHFGDEELRSGKDSNFSYVTAGPAEVFALNKKDFTSLLGPIESVLSRTEGAGAGAGAGRGRDKPRRGRKDAGAEEKKKEAAAAATPARKMLNIPFKELDHLATLGTGTFGRVKLVRHKSSNKPFALKILQKATIVKLNQTRNIMNEKNLLMQVNHPFILKLHATYKDRNCLFMLLELVQGGELFSRLQHNGGRVGLRDAQFYGACVLDAFEHLHAKNILYRDLKPENLLIDTEGFLKVVDFGFAKVVPDRTYTLCGTPEYLAPELVLGKGHDKGVDYWALGILIYEMVCGYSPFADHENADQMKICKNILNGFIKFPSVCRDRKIVDLIERLLERQIGQRLGCGRGGASDIKNHGFFKSINWEKLRDKKMTAPWKPRITNALDVSYFDQYDEADYVEPYRDDGSNWDRTF